MTTIHWGELTSHAGPIVNHYFLMMILMAMMGEIALHYQLLSWSDLRFLLYSNASLSLNSVVVFLQILFRFILGGRGLFLKREGHQFALKKDGMVYWYICLLLQSTTIVMYHMNHEKNIFFGITVVYIGTDKLFEL